MDYPKVPVKERCINSLLHYLMEIRPENPDWEYNTKIVSANRVNQPVEGYYPPGTIFLWQVQDSLEEEQSTHFMHRICDLDIIFFGGDATNPSMEYNIYESDILKRFHWVLRDRYHPDPCAAEIYMDYVESTPLFTPGSPLPAGGEMRWRMTYRHILGDPFKWDDSDTYISTSQLEDPNVV